MTPAEVKTRLTFRWDLLRGGMQGVLEPIWHTFVLLVAIRVFHASDNAKSILVSAGFLGLLLTPISMHASIFSGFGASLGRQPRAK